MVMIGRSYWTRWKRWQFQTHFTSLKWTGVAGHESTVLIWFGLVLRLLNSFQPCLKKSLNPVVLSKETVCYDQSHIRLLKHYRRWFVCGLVNHYQTVFSHYFDLVLGPAGAHFKTPLEAVVSCSNPSIRTASGSNTRHSSSGHTRWTLFSSFLTLRSCLTVARETVFFFLLHNYGSLWVLSPW